MAYFLDNYHEFGVNTDLKFTEEQEKYCRVVYKLDDKDGAVFSELWNPEKEYSDEYVIVPVTSTGYNKMPVPVSKGTCFANVIGSGDDKNHISSKASLSWIQLWAEVAGVEAESSCCCTDGNFYVMSGETETPLRRVVVFGHECDAVCGGTLVGGHVILGARAAATVIKNSSVYILPICNTHNVAYTGSNGWGVGYYMKVREDTNALELTGYLKNVRKYLE